MISVKTIKKVASDVAWLTNKLSHVSILQITNSAAIFNVDCARNTGSLETMLAKQAWLAVFIITSIWSIGVIEAIDINLAAFCFVSKLAQQVHFCVHRLTKYRSIARIPALVYAEVDYLAALNAEGDNLMLKRIVPELGRNRFSEALQTRRTSYESPMVIVY